MEQAKSFRTTDCERLSRLKIFSWLTPPELTILGNSLAISNYRPGEVIFYESARSLFDMADEL
jgi:hypothetical protein